jgi:hypothetical protein
VDAEDVAIYLADYEQTMLVPLPDGTDRTPLEIDATLAGRAFAAIAIQEADTGAGRRLWLPLLDGAERLGVLGLTLPRVDDALRKRCSWLATLVAEMILSKDQYTDGYSLARRRQPMSPAAETYAAVDQAIATRFGGERFVTGQLAQLDCLTGRLQWVNAGHPLPLLVRRAKVVDTLACHPVPPLGLGVGQPEIATAALEPADRVLFYTDGVTEGRNLAGEPFGEARLADLLVRETLAGQPAAETMRRLAHALLAHQGRTPHDDATMVFLEWPGPRPA